MVKIASSKTGSKRISLSSIRLSRCGAPGRVSVQRWGTARPSTSRTCVEAEGGDERVVSVAPIAAQRGRALGPDPRDHAPVRRARAGSELEHESALRPVGSGRRVDAQQPRLLRPQRRGRVEQIGQREVAPQPGLAQPGGLHDLDARGPRQVAPQIGRQTQETRAALARRREHAQEAPPAAALPPGPESDFAGSPPVPLSDREHGLEIGALAREGLRGAARELGRLDPRRRRLELGRLGERRPCGQAHRHQEQHASAARSEPKARAHRTWRGSTRSR